MESISGRLSRIFASGFTMTTAALLASALHAEPRLNAQRATGEPHWEGQIFLQGEAKEQKEATPILERPYRPLHVYGNLQRRHHYRDTVIPSRTDRTDRRGSYYGSK